MSIENEKGLGRLPSPDARDQLYRASAVLAAAPAPRSPYYYARLGRKLDQGATSECVGHAWRHYFTASPNMYKKPQPDEHDLYRGAQRHDVWAGEDYDGSSVRGGAKYAQKEHGLLLSYVWAYDVDTVLDWILSKKGPVVVGTNWYGSMFYPDEKGWITKLERGLAGGHAYIAYGANNKDGRIRFLNSWGTEWGDKGSFWMPAELVDRLIREQGEACMALENVEKFK